MGLVSEPLEIATSILATRVDVTKAVDDAEELAERELGAERLRRATGRKGPDP